MKYFIPGNGTPLHIETNERNAPCKCGSGKKQKRCCGNQPKYFTRKKVKECIEK